MMRIVAVACLVAMLGSWMPHEHRDARDAAHALLPIATVLAGGLADVAEMSADDAHEEHSSGTATAESGCALCRSKDERTGDRTRVQGLLPIGEPCVRLRTRLAAALPTPHAFGLHPTRAPPIA
jgi:hypothetical protein